MAPMKNILAAFALATFAVAAPVAPQNTVTETVWTTVDVTTTLYVDEPSAKPKVENAPPVTPAASTTSAAPVVVATPASSPSPAHPVAPVAPSPVAPVAPVAPAANSPAAFAVQAAPSSSTVAPVAAAPSALAAPAIQPKTAGASSGGPCEGSGNACSGDVTHYEGGLGACGWNVDTASEMQIALPHGLMGTQSNGNPYCGRSLTIKNPNGGTVQATVGDKCMGCEGHSIDLTDALFKAVVPNGDGRVSNIEWWFN